MKNKNIMILCKVIDNFGDIGVVYRLAKALCDVDSSLSITLVCSNLESFAKMAAQVDPAKKEQDFYYGACRWHILDWEQNPDFKFECTPFPVVLECFQCGRPDWLENILFDKNATETFHIFNIEYLTAEEYADDFHLLKSYTRSASVKKMFFMPGFTKKTAGLILDNSFLNALAEAENAPKDEHTFTVTLFSYERSFIEVFNALNAFLQKKQQADKNFKVRVLAANGKSLPFVKEAWQKTGRKVKLTELPFLSQEEWDKVLCSADFNFIRGEESLARACLSGKPFFWHAYVQEENYQLVKVNALLSRLEPFFNDSQTAQNFSTLWNEYNTPDTPLNEKNLLDLFEQTAQNRLTETFKAFADNLKKNGNLAENLLNYLSGEGL